MTEAAFAVSVSLWRLFMKCKILHESHGRMRVHLFVKRMTLDEADILEYHLRAIDGVTNVKVFDRTQDVIIQYQSDRATVIKSLSSFSFSTANTALVPEHTARKLNREFEEQAGVYPFKAIGLKNSSSGNR